MRKPYTHPQTHIHFLTALCSGCLSTAPALCQQTHWQHPSTPGKWPTLAACGSAPYTRLGHAQGLGSMQRCPSPTSCQRPQLLPYRDASSSAAPPPRLHGQMRHESASKRACNALEAGACRPLRRHYPDSLTMTKGALLACRRMSPLLFEPCLSPMHQSLVEQGSAASLNAMYAAGD